MSQRISDLIASLAASGPAAAPRVVLVSSARAELPSPTGVARRTVVITDDGEDILVEFGDWHTHGELERVESRHASTTTAVIGLLEAIVRDQRVLVYAEHSAREESVELVNVSDHDAILDELTAPRGPNRIRIESWGGSADREISLVET